MAKWWGERRSATKARTEPVVHEPPTETVPVAVEERGAESGRESVPFPFADTPAQAETISFKEPVVEEQPVAIPTEKPAMNTSIRLPLEPAMSSGAPTVIRAGLHLDGNIRTTDDILLEGSIRGEVTANSITVAAGATLSGNVSATVIVVDGMIEGVVRCLKLQVNTTGAVSGEIHHSILVVEAGAAIEGTVFRTDRLVEEPAPVAAYVAKAEPVQVARVQPQAVATSDDEELAEI